MGRYVGRPAAAVVSSAEERSLPERRVRRRRVARGVSDRRRIVLRCADGVTSKAGAAEPGAHDRAVGKWRRRFPKDRVEGLSDAPRSGRPRSMEDARAGARDVAPDAAHRSIRSMGREAGLSHTTARRRQAPFPPSFRAISFPISSISKFVSRHTGARRGRRGELPLLPRRPGPLRRPRPRPGGSGVPEPRRGARGADSRPARRRRRIGRRIVRPFGPARLEHPTEGDELRAAVERILAWRRPGGSWPETLFRRGPPPNPPSTGFASEIRDTASCVEALAGSIRRAPASPGTASSRAIAGSPPPSESAAPSTSSSPRSEDTPAKRCGNDDAPLSPAHPTAPTHATQPPPKPAPITGNGAHDRR